MSDRTDGVTAPAPIRDRIPDRAALLAGAGDAETFARLRAAGSIARPLGDERFLAAIEPTTARTLRPDRRGPKPRRELNALSP